MAVENVTTIAGLVPTSPLESDPVTEGGAQLRLLKVVLQADAVGQAQLAAHTGDTANPHAVTKTQVGLGSADNTSDISKPVSTATQTALNLKADISGQVFTGAISATNLSGTNTGDQAASGVVNIPAGGIVSDTVQAAINELDADKVPRTSTTGSAVLPSGTTAQRDGTPVAGYTRFNSDYAKPEVYNGTGWSGLGGADGTGGDAVFYVNDNTVDFAYTVPTNKNAMCAGPITFNAAVTVSAGSRFTVV